MSRVTHLMLSNNEMILKIETILNHKPKDLVEILNHKGKFHVLLVLLHLSIQNLFLILHDPIIKLQLQIVQFLSKMPYYRRHLSKIRGVMALALVPTTYVGG